MSNNLKNFPFVYYINLKEDINKKEFIENNFKKYNICNYKRIEAINGKVDNLSKIVKPIPKDATKQEIACIASHLKAIEEFLKSDKEEAIIMEDDCDISLSDSWGFCWGDFHKRIPNNYDIIQMVIISNYGIYARIHKRFLDEYSAACYLINRHYAEKIKKLYIKNDYYSFENINPRTTSEFLLYESGKSYSIPLFIYKQDAELESSIQNNDSLKQHHKEVHDVTVDFWENQKENIDDLMNLNSFFGNNLNLIEKNDGMYSKINEEDIILNDLFGSLNNKSFINIREKRDKKLKITVYAISKNSEPFIKGFCENIFEADEVIILDTGSTDNSVPLLRNKGAKVFENNYENFRFDVARNDCLKLVSDDTDLCVSIDMDEYIEKGWRSKLEKVYNKDIDEYFYKNNYKIENGIVATSLYVGKIHRKSGFYWKYPVHEILENDKKIKTEVTDIIVNHFPILSKRNYLPLLELAVKEYEGDERPLFFLSREYYFDGDYDKSISSFNEYLKITANHIGEFEGIGSYRANANIILAKIMQKLNKDPLVYALRAVSENPYMRESWHWLAQSWMLHDNWKSVEAACWNALAIQDDRTSISKEGIAWDDSLMYRIIEECKKHYKEEKKDE